MEEEEEARRGAAVTVTGDGLGTAAVLVVETGGVATVVDTTAGTLLA